MDQAAVEVLNQLSSHLDEGSLVNIGFKMGLTTRTFRA